MFQNFDATTSPDQGPPRMALLRDEMAKHGLDAFLVPRADAHQGEYVASCDERLAWLTGFTGSAGFAAVLANKAAIFVDGRYRVQVRTQTADLFTPVNWPEVKLGDWLAGEMPDGGIVGFDPWLHTAGEIETLETRLASTGVVLRDCDNLVDKIWIDQPPHPTEPVVKQPKDFAGTGDETKRADISSIIREAGQNAGVLTLPDSICWLLNIRGSDIARIPVTQAFAILFADGQMQLFSDPEKFENLGPDPDIELRHWDAFPDALATLKGPVRVDKNSAPLAVTRILGKADVDIVYDDDPCILPKARKNPTEIAGARSAQLRDATAMCRFLAWLDRNAPDGGLTEIDVVKRLEAFRRAANALKDISFDTIAGSGPNGAIVHYRVTTETNRQIEPGTLLLVDSGGQYQDGTTDITRTIAIGQAGAEERTAFTRVLQGMISISRARWPKGLAGRDLDPLARIALWRAGQDFDHGTGHGVGAYLSVHEGPARISRVSNVPLEPGMILSNEPGYYREGAFGIRIENLVVVRTAEDVEGGDAREMLDFETLTWVPIDLALVDTHLLSNDERDWLNWYHSEVLQRVGPTLDGQDLEWLKSATRAI